MSRRDGEDVMDGAMRNTPRTLTGSLEEKRRIRRKKEMEKRNMRGTSLDISGRFFLDGLLGDWGGRVTIMLEAFLPWVESAMKKWVRISSCASRRGFTWKGL